MQDPVSNRHSRVTRLALLLPAFLFSACSVLDEGGCVDIGSYGIHVTVEDSLSEGPISSVPSLAVVDGDYTETHPQPNGAGAVTFLAAFERPGRYDVTVSAAGYQDWNRNNIVVGRQPGRCGYLTSTQLTARMAN